MKRLVNRRTVNAEIRPKDCVKINFYPYYLKKMKVGVLAQRIHCFLMYTVPKVAINTRKREFLR